MYIYIIFLYSKRLGYFTLSTLLKFSFNYNIIKLFIFINSSY